MQGRVTPSRRLPGSAQRPGSATARFRPEPHGRNASLHLLNGARPEQAGFLAVAGGAELLLAPPGRLALLAFRN